MTAYDSRLAEMGDATPDTGPMRWFSQIGTMLVAHRLPPVPDVYDLLWRYVRDEDHDLSLAIDRAITAGSFDLAAIGSLRRAHCGILEASEVSALVEAAHGKAGR